MFLKHNAFSIAWAILILVVSGLPGSQFEKTEYEYADKIIHGLLFGVWFYLLVVGWIKQRNYPMLRKHVLFKAFILCFFYGVLVEVLQGFVFIDRSVEVMDLVANVIGTLGGMSLFYAIYGTESYT